MNILIPSFPLRAYGKTLSTSADRLGYLTPTNSGLPMATLRTQYQAQGYLWLKGILSRDAVLEFRGRFFRAFRDANLSLIQPGTDPVAGIYDAVTPAAERARYNRVLMEIVRWADYEAFCMMEPIRRFYAEFFGGDPYLHKRKILRYNVPGDTHTTAAHYDLIYLRAGTERVSTSWIPIGDTPASMGGLIYLEGSDAIGRRMEAEFAVQNANLSPEERISAYNRNMAEGGWISKDLPNLAERFSGRWLIADYEAGDMMVHSPYMIHAATENIDPQRIRLSTDIRYQRVSDEIDVRWGNHWTLEDML